MSTLVSYILAAILQILNVAIPQETQDISHLAPHQCEESISAIPSSFIINNEQEQQHK